MNTAIIRQQLHNYLEKADDEKINALYTIIEKDIKENEFEYPDDLKDKLDKRYLEYRNGSVEMITPAESKKRITSVPLNYTKVL